MTRPLSIYESEAKRSTAIGAGVGVHRTAPGTAAALGSDRSGAGASTPEPAPSAVPAEVAETRLTLNRRFLDVFDTSDFERDYPTAIAVRSFVYMLDDFPEVEVPCLHVEQYLTRMVIGGDEVARDRKPVVVVYPLRDLSCDVRCGTCKNHPGLGDLCAECGGTKRRKATMPYTKFVDGGDRYDSGGSHWRMGLL